MSHIPYSYSDAALTNSQPWRAVASPARSDAVPNTEISPERRAAIDNLRQAFGTLPQAEQDSHIATMKALNLRDNAAVSYLETMMAAAAPVPPAPPVAAVATIETAVVGDESLQNRLTGHLAQFDFSKDEELRRQGYRAPMGPVPGLTTFAAVDSTQAAVDNSYASLGDLSPTQGLPNLKGGRGFGGPDFA